MNAGSRLLSPTGLGRCSYALSGSVTILDRIQEWAVRKEVEEEPGKRLLHVGGLRNGVPACGLSRGRGSAASVVPLVKTHWASGFSSLTSAVAQEEWYSDEEGEDQKGQERTPVAPEDPGKSKILGGKSDALVKQAQKSGEGGLQVEEGFLSPAQRWLLTANLKEELLRSLRSWPLDADLDEYLKDGKLGGAELTFDVVRWVMFILSFNGQLLRFSTQPAPGFRSFHSDDWFTERQAEGRGAKVKYQAPDNRSKKRQGEGSDADKPAARVYDVSDAKRALNLFNWWQKRDWGPVPYQLLHHLLISLGRANLPDEIAVIAERYKYAQHPRFHIGSALIAAYSEMGLPEKVAGVYFEAREGGWPISATAVGIVLRALRELNATPEDILTFYINEHFQSRFDSSAYAMMIEMGITVDDICGAYFNPPIPVFIGLIEALDSLGRRSEAAGLVSGLVSSWHRELNAWHLVELLVTLVKAGFGEEARAIAQKQGQQQELSATDALTRVLRFEEDTRFSTKVYRTLMKLEGPHRKSIVVHASAVDAFAKLEDVDGVYEAYQAGKKLEGETFPVGTFGRVIRALCTAGRAAEAEGVLEDYFAARRQNAPGSENLGRLRESTFNKLFEMYETQSKPDKIVALADAMVKAQLLIRKNTFEMWINTMWARGWVEEAEKLEDAMWKMGQYKELAYCNRMAANVVLDRELSGFRVKPSSSPSSQPPKPIRIQKAVAPQTGNRKRPSS